MQSIEGSNLLAYLRERLIGRDIDDPAYQRAEKLFGKPGDRVVV